MPVRDGKAPWPLVGECLHLRPTSNHSCPQCDRSHRHSWKSFGLPNSNAVRCLTCGARKCDHATCNLRRHHEAAHIWRLHRVDPLTFGHMKTRYADGPPLVCSLTIKQAEEDHQVNEKTHGYSILWVDVDCPACLEKDPGPVPTDLSELEEWLRA